MLVSAGNTYYRRLQEKSGGWTRLHSAASSGDIEQVQKLLARWANVNASDNDGDTPLHIAALLGYKDIVEVLVDHGADVTAKDNTGRTPLYEAARRRHWEVVKLLKAKANNLSTKTK